MKKMARETRRAWLVSSLYVIAVLLVSACGRLSPTGSCSSFYREGVSFALNLGDANNKKFAFDMKATVLPKIVVTGTIKSEKDTTKIRSLPCEPDWTIEPEGVVKVERNAAALDTGEYILMPGQRAGIAKVTGVVTGEGEPATATLWAIVTSEQEPNNGPAGAHPLAEKTTGALSQRLDTDWFFVRVPANKAYQISLELFPSLDATTVSGTLCRIRAPATPPLLSPSSVNEDDLNCEVQKEINTTYFNETGTDLLIFVKIAAAAAADLVTNPEAYQLEAAVFDSPVGNTLVR
jgi:hypothetical protein